MDDLRLTTIATFCTPEDAAVIRLVLEDEGIATCMECETIVGMVWYYGNAVGWIKLQVAEADVFHACEILKQKLSKFSTEHPSCTCPNCGVDVPAGFKICWSCQTPLPEDAIKNTNTLSTLADDDEVRETDAGDDMAWRACRAAIFGSLFSFLPLFTLYSMWLLVRLIISKKPLSKTGNRHFYVALALNFIVCLFFGLLFIRI
jgi:hypothetical protein